MTLEFKWTTSRGRDTYGYNICSLYVDGNRVSRCNGGGYDMKGTVLGNWIARAYKDRLLALKPEDMPAQSHWKPDHDAWICRSVSCVTKAVTEGVELSTTRVSFESLKEIPICEKCGAEMDRDHHAGERIDDGRYFYGLTFHDPNYDPGKAVIGVDCSNRTLGTEGEGEGLTVAEAEEKGISFGLERYQSIYTASSKHSTDRHTIPSIDGACGFSSVEQIMKVIGLSLQYVATKSRGRSAPDIYILHDERETL